MSQVLIITAHPSSSNITNAIADTYREVREEEGDTVEIVDLYTDKELPFLVYDNDDDLTSITLAQEYYQDKVKYADHIVFVYPFWWGSMPAILKNWIDQVFTKGFAFKYTEKGRPEGLLHGRSVKIFTTTGSPKIVYCINGVNRANKNIWKKTIVKFCAMDFDGYHVYGGVDSSGKSVDAILSSVKRIAQS